MEQNGYMLIKILKTVNIYLWAKTREELEGELQYLKSTKGYRIVPYFKDGNKCFLKVDNQLLRIQ